MKKTVASFLISAVIMMTAVSAAAAQSSSSELSVRFGYDGKAFTARMLNNETAQKIIRDVGSSSWNLPIYHYDDYPNWEFMQYYDISRRYTYASNPVKVTAVKAGEIYYSHPNRIILFYHDGTVNMELTKIGEIEATKEFVKAVEENPVLQGWGNKIITISKRR